jgi:hypothetical protein
MSDDLVKRLRWLADHASFEPRMHHVAADRIEKLETALARIAKHDLQAIAMDALRPGERVKETEGS